jgi:hypothetical protein
MGIRNSKGPVPEDFTVPLIIYKDIVYRGGAGFKSSNITRHGPDT